MSQTAPYGTRDCSALGCLTSMLGNKQCDPECNYPDCGSYGFDDGDCCAESNTSPVDTANHPLVRRLDAPPPDVNFSLIIVKGNSLGEDEVSLSS
ncbi:hypothetical protein CYMTET_31686 [Cymbomonas tetramitiformis]|uniref:LNR domain-containing protein n=1 Tax=Cymbomonas tetramitiformis TaxID=36881 RepID=A0AAE0FHD9_9CHLO|nr:hypothetical protein CYMTET_31686 [Cymbomonas tetramitiformis]